LSPYRRIKGKYDYDEEKKCLYRFQNEKMQELLDQYGRDAIVAITPYIDDLRAFAKAIAKVVLHGIFDWEYIKHVRTTSISVASYIVEELYWTSGLNSILSSEDNCKKEDLGWTLSCIPLREDVATFVDNSSDSDCQHTYWERVSIWGMQAENHATIDKYVIRFLEHHRPFTLIHYFGYSHWNNAKLIIRILEAAVKQYPSAEPTGFTLSHVHFSHVEEMFSGINPESDQPRTAVGVTTDNKMIFFVCEGREMRQGVYGLTTADVANILLDLGCVEAINLDGGGSSCMLVNGQETILVSDSTQRAVASTVMLK
jgi:hypothetical protein